jgi:hypothetical protein
MLLEPLVEMAFPLQSLGQQLLVAVVAVVAHLIVDLAELVAVVMVAEIVALTLLLLEQQIRVVEVEVVLTLAHSDWPLLVALESSSFAT